MKIIKVESCDKCDREECCSIVFRRGYITGKIHPDCPLQDASDLITQALRKSTEMMEKAHHKEQDTCPYTQGELTQNHWCEFLNQIAENEKLLEGK